MADSSTLRTLDQLSGPPGLPLIGNAHQLPSASLHQVLERWAETYGSAYRVRLGPRPALVLSDPALCQEALRARPEQFSRIASLELISDELGVNGLFSSEGERWRRQRRVWIAALNAAQLKPFAPRLTEVTQRLLQHWQRAAASGEAVDVQADLMRYTVDVTLRFAMGHDANTLEQGGDVIQNHLHTLMAAAGRRLAAPFPYWRWFKLPADYRVERDKALLRAKVDEYIAAARARLQAEPGRPPANLLEALLVTRDSDGSQFSDDDIHGNVMTVLLAGEDTTANTLAWMMHFLAEHPAAQARLRAEVDERLGDAALWTDPVGGEPPRYLEAVMSEALRLKPVGPFFMLGALQDLALGDLWLPKGTPLVLLMRRAAQVAGLHADDAAFRPERWLEASPQAYAQQLPMPFGGYARVCPGRNLALVEIRSVIAMLMRHFTLEPAPGHGPVREQLNFTLTPADLRLRLRAR